MASLDFEKEKKIFRDFYNENYDFFGSAKDALVTIVKSILSDEISISAVLGRVKDREESIKKFSDKYRGRLEDEQKPYEIKEHISDLIGLRVIALYKSDVEKIKDILSSEFEVLDITNKIAAMEGKEDSFGYKDLQVDLKLKPPRNEMRGYSKYKDLRFEVQIRTIIQDAWSVLDHKIKYKKSIPINLKRRINTLAALFELADREFYSIKEETERFQREEKSQYLSQDEQLNVFSFLAVLDEHFPEYRFPPNKVDGFVEELIAYGSISPKQLNEIIQKEFDKVESFKEFLAHKEGKKHLINPDTEIRHIMYKFDKDKYRNILYKNQREQFENWLAENQD